LPLPWLAAIALLAQSALGGTMASQWAAERCLAAGDGCQSLLIHRLGAWPAAGTILVMALGSIGLSRQHRALGRFSGAALLLVGVQILLGISTLRHQLLVPGLTVAHQLTAALLIGLMGAVLGQTLSRLRATAPLTSPPQLSHG
jgi:cytochrome c oxidase assembly protein subunit 15